MPRNTIRPWQAHKGRPFLPPSLTHSPRSVSFATAENCAESHFAKLTFHRRVATSCSSALMRSIYISRSFSLSRHCLVVPRITIIRGQNYTDLVKRSLVEVNCGGQEGHVQRELHCEAAQRALYGEISPSPILTDEVAFSALYKMLLDASVTHN